MLVEVLCASRTILFQRPAAGGSLHCNLACGFSAIGAFLEMGPDPASLDKTRTRFWWTNLIMVVLVHLDQFDLVVG